LYYTPSGIITPVGGRPVHTLREDIIKQDFVHCWLITKIKMN